jgi:hypothetical protein
VDIHSSHIEEVTDTEGYKAHIEVLILMLCVNPFLVEINIAHKTEHSAHYDKKSVSPYIGVSCIVEGGSYGCKKKEDACEIFDINTEYASFLVTHYKESNKEAGSYCK